MRMWEWDKRIREWELRVGSWELRVERMGECELGGGE